MPETDQRRLPWHVIIIYCVLFFGAWTLREFLLRPWMASQLSELDSALINAAIKLLLWTLPAILLVRHYRADMTVPSLFTEPIKWDRLGLWSLGLIVYNLVVAFFTFGTLRIHPDFKPISLIGTVLFVGITEEAVFRGFLLNSFAKRWKPQTALVISALLFVLIHFPTWYTKGLFDTPVLLLRSCLTIFVLGVLFGIAFLRDRNLVSPIIMHMVWNLAASMLFG